MFSSSPITPNFLRFLYQWDPRGYIMIMYQQRILANSFPFQRQWRRSGGDGGDISPPPIFYLGGMDNTIIPPNVDTWAWIFLLKLSSHLAILTMKFQNFPRFARLSSHSTLISFFSSSPFIWHVWSRLVILGAPVIPWLGALHSMHPKCASCF